MQFVVRERGLAVIEPEIGINSLTAYSFLIPFVCALSVTGTIEIA